MSNHQVRVTRLHVLPNDAALFDEMATVVRIEDEAAGEFVEVEQQAPGCGKILIEPEEWPALRRAINAMIRQCKKEAGK